MTNTTKALIIAAVNALFGVAVAFGVGISPEQVGAILTALNAVGGLVVALTYKRSAKRIPDDGFVVTLDPNQE